MKGRHELPPVMADVKYGLDNRLFEDDVGQALLRICSADVLDSRTRGMIQHRVRRHQYARAMSGVPFSKARLDRGKLILGYDLDGGILRTFIQYLNAHLLCMANTGAGKTARECSFALQLIPRVAGCWLLDLRKREFRVLRRYLARMGVNLIILPIRRMRINPLQTPVGVEPEDWVPRVADMLISVLGLPPRASKLVQAALFRLYRRFDAGAAGRQSFPTLFDLYRQIEADRRANPQARLAILDNLAPVLYSLGPEVLAYNYGWRSYDLARMHLVIEFAGVGEVEKNLVLNTLVLSEFASRVARGISNPTMDLWICCDEANRICSASPDRLRNPVADLTGLVRGTGIGLDLSILSPSGVTPAVMSNTATKILGRCGSGADYAAAGACMGLTPDQLRWAQLNLRPGMFIGQLGEGDWRHPFVFTSPLINPARAPEEYDTPGDMKPLLELPGAPGGCTTTQERPDGNGGIGPLLRLPVRSAQEFAQWGRDTQEKDAPWEPDGPLESRREYIFCKAVMENPLQASSTYPKLAGMSSKTALEIRRKLVAGGLIRERVFESGGRGRARLLLEATPAGRAAVERYESRPKGCS